MSKQFMPEERPDRRLQMLRDHADKTEQTKYYKDLSQEDLDIKREKLTDNMIKVSDMEDSLTEIKENYKEKMDPLKRENKELLVEVKTRKQVVEGTLFHLSDHENSIMETYDENGDFVSSRRLRPDEKQPKLFPIKTVNE